MESIIQAKHVIAISKALKRYSASDIRIATFFHASYMAGRAGLVSSAFRSQDISYEKAVILAGAEGFPRHELKNNILPWLEGAGLCNVQRSGNDIVKIRSLVLSYDSILQAVANLHQSLDPTQEDLACISLLAFCSKLPATESDALQFLSASFGEERANTAITLAKSYRIIDYREGMGLREPLLYSARLWSHCISKADRYLSSLSPTDKAVLVELVSRVRKYQGMPRGHLEAFAKQQNATHMLDVAIRLRLIHETRLEMAGGQSRSFLTTVHFYEEIAAEHGEDVCDRVKIFLDSIRNGQHFGDSGTGRILDPAVLLSKLLQRGSIGPCTAIGTDYLTSEKAGIVTVRKASPNSNRCFLELVQKDTVEKVHEVITTGYVEQRPEMDESHVQEGRQFQSIEQCSPLLADVPAGLEEAERAIILQLREG